MIVRHNMVIDCSAISPSECIKGLITKLGHKASFKLTADSPTGIVHGAVTVYHATPPDEHVIVVEVYDKDEPPTYGPKNRHGHKTRFKRPAVMPTENTILNRLKSGGNP